MTSAIVIGQSHCVAIQEALSRTSSTSADISVYRLESKNRPYETDTVTAAEAVAIVEGSPPDSRLFLSTYGTYHNIWGLLRSGPDFDFLLDPHDAPDPAGAVHIPHRAVASAFEAHLAKPSFIRKMQKAAKAPVYLLSTPPPKGDNEFMLERLMSQKKKSYRGRAVEDIGIERPLARLKLWQMEMQAIDRWASAEGMQFIPAPVAALDGSGFLDKAFYSDATHANERYGALVVDQIRAVLSAGSGLQAYG